MEQPPARVGGAAADEIASGRVVVEVDEDYGFGFFGVPWSLVLEETVHGGGPNGGGGLA